ncbi:MAG: ABC transporter permease [Candidatus Poribacteria bacterium]|nr:ABC transporter permease [Candidatus Poribacteria bacterium]
MSYIESVLQGFRAIFENKLRSSLTLLGITIGIAAVLSMVSISGGARQIILADIEKLGGADQFMMFRSGRILVNGKWVRNRSNERFTYDDVLAIERECPSVERVIPRNPEWGGVRITAGEGINTRETRSGYQGTTTAMMEGLEWYPESGRFVEEADEFDWNKVAVIGATTAYELFDDQDPVGQQIKINGKRFTVVGVMESRGKSIQYGWDFDSTAILPLSTTQARFNGNDEISMLSIQATSTEKIIDAVAEVKQVLGRRHNGEEFYRIFSPGLGNLEFVTTLSNMLRVVLGGIAGFSLFIGGVGIMNIMLVSVTERTKEIGLRKALGGRRRDILIQFIIEATVLCLTGGFLGLVVGISFGWGSAKIISNPAIGGFVGTLIGFQGDWVAWPYEVSIPWVLISIFVSLAIGVFFGFYPAWKAARLTPIDALRHV